MDLPVIDKLKENMDKFWEEVESGTVEFTEIELKLAEEILKRYPNAFKKRLPSPDQS